MMKSLFESVSRRLSRLFRHQEVLVRLRKVMARESRSNSSPLRREGEGGAHSDSPDSRLLRSGWLVSISHSHEEFYEDCDGRVMHFPEVWCLVARRETGDVTDTSVGPCYTEEWAARHELHTLPEGFSPFADDSGYWLGFVPSYLSGE